MKVKNVLLASVSILALITGLTVSKAEGAEPSYTPHPICVSLKAIAVDVMRMRQNNVPIEDVKKMVESTLSLSVIDGAYESVVVGKDELESVVSEFADDMFTACDDGLPGTIVVAN